MKHCANKLVWNGTSLLKILNGQARLPTEGAGATANKVISAQVYHRRDEALNVTMEYVD